MIEQESNESDQEQEPNESVATSNSSDQEQENNDAVASLESSDQHPHDSDLHDAPTTKGQLNTVSRIFATDSMSIISIEESGIRGEGAAVQVVHLLVTVVRGQSPL